MRFVLHVLYVLGIAALLGSIAWFWAKPDWEPGLAIITSVIGLLGLYANNKNSAIKGPEKDRIQVHEAFSLSTPLQEIEAPEAFINGEPDSVAALIKESGSRSDELTRQRSLQKPFGSGSHSIATAAATLEEKEIEEQLKRHHSDVRHRLANTACYQLWAFRDALYNRAQELAPTASITSTGSSEYGGAKFLSRTLHLGKAQLSFFLDLPHISSLDRNYVMRYGYEMKFNGWDTLTTAKVELKQALPAKEHWSLLWYGKRLDDDDYRWWEAFYRATAKGVKDTYAKGSAQMWGVPESPHFEPTSAAHPIDNEGFERFCEIWLELLALAAKGKL